MSVAAAAGLMLVLGAAQAAAQGASVYKVGGDGVTAPVLVHEVKPTYTEGAMRRRVQGAVQLSAVVKADGHVGDVAVTKSLDPELDEQAMTAAKQWEFKPGTKDGQPVAVQVNIELTFRLKDRR
jgi:protein TonB